MSSLFLLVVLVIVLALGFDFSNGFHDAANSIATVVATRVLRPYQAVLWAAFWNFVAAFAFDVAVAKTIGKGTIDPKIVDVYVILAALVGAVAWNITTAILGLPTSSSHALVGGLVGAALVKAGTSAINREGLWTITKFIVLSPLTGMVIALALMSMALWLLANAHPGPVMRWSRRLQLVSSAAYSLGHGMNDAQKTMGIIAVLLVSMAGKVPELAHAPSWIMPPHNLEHIPWAIILSAHLAIALGTMSGGWKIVRTMGMRITELDSVGGVCAETAGAITLIGLAFHGIPVSTTHTITGAIVGVGASRRLSAVRWGIAAHIIWAWVLTIPAAAGMSALTYGFIHYVWPIMPLAMQGVVGVALAAGTGYSFLVWLKSARAENLAHA